MLKNQTTVQEKSGEEIEGEFLSLSYPTNLF